MVAAPKLRYSFEEYLLVDVDSNVRHEFMDGLILGMAGGTPDHARLTVFSEALRVRAQQTGFAGYPDVTVVCTELQRAPADANTVTNPSVVVEVPSKSTAEYDRTDKLRHYQTIASIQHVVLVAYDSPKIEVWTRNGQDFEYAAYAATQRALLSAIDCSLDVDAVYRDPLAS